MPKDHARGLRVHVLGDVEVDGVERTALGSRKARQLLRELALARGRPVSTDSLAEALWQDDLPRDPAAQVAVLISRLRGAVGAECITHGDSGYTLHYDWLDIEAAEELTRAAEERLSRDRYAAALGAARGALVLLKSASPSETSDVPAERLAAHARHLCSRALLASGDSSAAVEAGQQALDADPLDEEALRLVMSGLAAQSRSPAALQLYEVFKGRLLDELGVSPSPATETVHRSVLRGESVPGITVGSRGSGARGSRTAPSVLVGRETELAALDDAWSAAQTHGMVRVAVEGEPGSGKTFLVRAWLRELGSETPVLRVRCDEVNPSLPLQPILDAVYRRLRELGSDRAAELLGPERRLLAPLFGAPFETSGDSLDVALSLAASSAGAAILNAALISAMSRLCAVPAVLFIDDVHRVDSASASWLAQLVTRAPDTRLLVIVTQRTTERRTVAADRTLVVGPLSLDATTELVGAERAAGLHARTGGNALFLTELANAKPGNAVPATVQASIMARCDGVPDVAETLRGAAVLGSSVDIDLLARVLRMDPIRVIDHMEQGTRLALLEERDAHFVFRHEIVREAMAASAGGLRQAWLHREAALSMQAAPDSDVLIVAEHARQSGESHIAARALARASLVAMRRFDHVAARALIDDSLTYEVTTEALLQRARLGLWQGRYGDAEADAGLALERADDPQAFEVAGAIAYYRRQFVRSRELADAIPDRTTDPRLRLGGLIIGARSAHAAGDLTTALALIERATGVADTFGLVRPNSVHAFIQIHRGAVQSALSLTETTRPMSGGEPSSTAYTSVHEHFIGGYALATCGRVNQALERWERGAAEAGRQGFVRYMSLCTNLNSWVYRGIGELNRARESNHQARESGRAVDYRELEAFAVLDLCETDLIGGDSAGAAAILDGAVTMTSEDYAYRWRHLLRIAVIEGRIALLNGDSERARETATAARMRAGEHGARRYELLAALVEFEATCALGGSVDREQLMRVCRELPSLAGPEAWSLVGNAAAVTGVDACATLAESLAADLATALPDALATPFRRYARTRLDMMSTSGRRG